MPMKLEKTKFMIGKCSNHSKTLQMRALTTVQITCLKVLTLMTVPIPATVPQHLLLGKQDLQSEPTAWVNLSKPLQELLPNESGITYMVTEMETLPTERFLGAPANAYKATSRINITRPEKAQEWLQNMMKHSKCTYRHTRGRAPGLKRVLYKAEMHC